MATSTPDDQTITLTKQFAAVGDKETRTKVKDLDLTLEFVASGKASSEHSIEHGTVEKLAEVKAVDGEMVTKLLVEYRRHEKVREGSKGKADEKSPVAGKSYFVELKGKHVVITSLDGKVPPTAELEELKEDHKNFGKGPELLKAFPPKVKVGDSLDEFAKVFSVAAAGGPQGKSDIKSATAKVVGVRDEKGIKIVTLAIDIRMEGELRSGMKGKVAMAGTIDIRADRCWPVASKVAGPVEFSFEGKGVSGSGKGKLSEVTSAVHTP